MRCAVRNCGNNNRNCNRTKWRYFHFPKEQPNLQKWIDFCQRDNINPATACICNEHFAPDDFERNMQYELGFSRKNPTKLKPGSFPSVNGPQKLAKNLRGRVKKSSTNVSLAASSKINNIESELLLEETHSSEGHETIEIQLCDFTTDFEGFEESSSSFFEKVAKPISKSERLTTSQSPEDADCPSNHRHWEVEILDPLNPPSNAKDHVEIIDSEGDNYVKHLELEVCSLKREIFFLKDERQKLKDEIRNLKETIQKSEVQEIAEKQLQIFVKSSKRSPQD
ncbi:uncharacterized protein LOC6544571 isoform X2 [Drosophila erecta]|uniref:THAP-type domain-containing protein n=1 Tax=Drosophila erecta TaxID=7220 RepID=B3NGZ1_DROER|nr:uncharacterized protein LOC6544571 isoform X2 [Drosophila erecta]EDV51448.2 uncharacterized protein Dere_GG15522 [Drosophila erecta]